MEMRPPHPSDDEPVIHPDRLTSAEWRADRTMLVAKAVGVVAFGVIPTVFGLNLASRWFGYVVAAALALYGLRDVVAPIRLRADADGVTVVRGFNGRARFAWPQIERLRIDKTRRGEFLEVDAGDSLFLLSRYDLGMPPYRALEMLEGIRPA